MHLVQTAVRIMIAIILIPGPFVYSQEMTIPAGSTAELVNAQAPSSLDPTGKMISETTAVATSINDFADHKAEVFFVKGEVKLMKKGAEAWILAEKGMVIEAGDQLLTGEGAYLEIAYDHHYLDIARVGEKTHAEFLSIEPTNVLLEDGSIFSALDGLPKGSTYQVSTPTAVAAVRGTHFDVSYASATGEFFAATIPVKEDGHESIIEVTDVKPDGTQGETAELFEGVQVSLENNQILEPLMLEPINPDVMSRAQDHFERMADNVPNFNLLRDEGKALLPGFENKRDALSENEDFRGGEVSEKEDDQSEKLIQGPHDGNDPGGGLDKNENGSHSDAGMHRRFGEDLKQDDTFSTDHLVDEAFGENSGSETMPSFSPFHQQDAPRQLEGMMAPEGFGQQPFKGTEHFMEHHGMRYPDSHINFQDPLRELPPLDPSLEARTHFQEVMRDQQERIRKENLESGTLPHPPPPPSQILPPPPPPPEQGGS